MKSKNSRASHAPRRKARAALPRAAARSDQRQLQTLLSASLFDRIQAEYLARWGVGLLAVDRSGRVVLGSLRRISASARAAYIECFARVVQESWRWGEPALTFGPDGRLICCVPLMQNNTLLGGLIADGLPETVCAARDPSESTPPRATEALLATAIANNLTNSAHLALQRTAAGRERERAEAIHAIKESGYDTIREAYLREEPALLATVKRGDRCGAREILNRLLVGIYHLAGNRLDLLKSLTLELVVMLYRAAVEAGANPTELLGMNYDCLQNLAAIDDEERLCHWLTERLERLMDGMRTYQDHPNTVLIQQALRYMSQHLDRGLSRDEVAHVACLSPSHFSHLLQQKIGRSFREILQEYRIDRAAEHLRRTSISIAEIARQCGFRDPSHFGKTFHRRMGVTPLGYRRQQASKTPPHVLTRKSHE